MKDKFGFKILVVLISIFFVQLVNAQETVVKGIVVDSITKSRCRV